MSAYIIAAIAVAAVVTMAIGLRGKWRTLPRTTIAFYGCFMLVLGLLFYTHLELAAAREQVSKAVTDMVELKKIPACATAMQ